MSDNAVKLEDLTKDQRDRLKREIIERERADKEAKKADLQEYRAFKDIAIIENFERLKRFSMDIETLKDEVTAEMNTVIDIKKDLFAVKLGDYSQTLTTEDGTRGIMIGVNTIDGWRDEVNEGVLMINEYLDSLCDDQKSKNLVGVIRDLLSRNLRGDLKASRVLRLEKVVEQFGSPEKLVKGLEIIKGAYKPKETSRFIKAFYKDDKGEKKYLNLSLTA